MKERKKSGSKWAGEELKRRGMAYDNPVRIEITDAPDTVFDACFECRPANCGRKGVHWSRCEIDQVHALIAEARKPRLLQITLGQFAAVV